MWDGEQRVHDLTQDEVVFLKTRSQEVLVGQLQTSYLVPPA